MSNTQLIVPGNASPSQVLSGHTFSAGTNYNATGSMPNNGTWVGNPGATQVNIPNGYHNNSYIPGDANLAAANILSGISIFGVAGNVNPISGNFLSHTSAGAVNLMAVEWNNLTSASGYEMDAWFEDGTTNMYRAYPNGASIYIEKLDQAGNLLTQVHVTPTGMSTAYWMRRSRDRIMIIDVNNNCFIVDFNGTILSSQTGGLFPYTSQYEYIYDGTNHYIFQCDNSGAFKITDNLGNALASNTQTSYYSNNTVFTQINNRAIITINAGSTAYAFVTVIYKNNAGTWIWDIGNPTTTSTLNWLQAFSLILRAFGGAQ